jgi:EAL domain-containing protein (putative c-di-GMP-specific phosphodiesterase class I)
MSSDRPAHRGRVARAARAGVAAARDALRDRDPVAEPGGAPLALALSRALRLGDGLGLAYQPMLDLATGRTVAVEALLRWERPGHGPVPAADAIAAAEASGLIVPLGRWVLARACRDAAELGVTVAVNLSPRQLEDPWLVADVDRCLAEAGLPPSALILELTESELVADLEVAAPVLARLRALGVRIALDDVGAGHSRMSYVRAFPVDVLKLDRSLVGDPRLLRAFVRFAEALGATTVAEGIERPEQLAELRRLGCLGQGYLLGRPVPAVELSRERAGRTVRRLAPTPEPLGV